MGHPELEVAFATSDKWVGEPVAERLGVGPRCKLAFRPHEDAAKLSRVVDLVVLASSAELAMQTAPAIAEHARVVDLSGAFRLEAASYPAWYGFDHTAPAELEHAFYGLPELFGPAPRETRIVSNPGCYATAALLAIAPLLRDALAGPDVFVDGKSGASGAGRRAEASYSFVELAEDVRAYKVGRHPHTPEIARHTHRFANVTANVTFTPHLVPLRRGLVVTAYLKARDALTTEQAREVFERTYAKAPFVRVVDIEDVSVHGVAGTPNALVGVSVTGGNVIAMCAIDNLMKGAASQAMQNVNALLGLPETTGLEGCARFAP